MQSNLNHSLCKVKKGCTPEIINPCVVLVYDFSGVYNTSRTSICVNGDVMLWPHAALCTAGSDILVKRVWAVPEEFRNARPQGPLAPTAARLPPSSGPGHGDLQRASRSRSTGRQTAADSHPLTKWKMTTLGDGCRSLRRTSEGARGRFRPESGRAGGCGHVTFRVSIINTSAM